MFNAHDMRQTALDHATAEDRVKFKIMNESFRYGTQVIFSSIFQQKEFEYIVEHQTELEDLGFELVFRFTKNATIVQIKW